MTLGLPDIISSKIWPATSSFFVLSRFIFHKKDHPYIMSAKYWMDVARSSSFADLQYYICTDIVGQKKSEIMLT